MPVAQFTAGSNFCGDEQFAGRAIERVAEAVAVEVGQKLAILAVNLLIGQDHFVDAVIVPLVVRRHLVDPLGHAGVGVARPDGHRPLVVAGTLLRIPGRGIARPVVDQVQFGIEGIPAPGVAAADLPLIALPGLERRVGADRLAERRRLLRVDEEVGIGTFGIGAPRQLAVFDVIRADPAAHAELAAGYADKHLVLEHERRVGAGLALRRIAVLHRPDDGAGLGVEGDERGVGLVQEDLAVGVGEAAIDRVAAHDGNHVRILLGLVFPKDPAVVVEIEGEDGVGEGRIKIHCVADDERRALVAAQNAGRKGPCRRQLVHVGGGYLIELREGRAGEVAARHHPLLRVVLKLSQFVVREGVPGAEERGYPNACKQQFAHSSSSQLATVERRTTDLSNCQRARIYDVLSWDGVDSVSRQSECGTPSSGESRFASD